MNIWKMKNYYYILNIKEIYVGVIKKCKLLLILFLKDGSSQILLFINLLIDKLLDLNIEIIMNVLMVNID